MALHKFPIMKKKSTWRINRRNYYKGTRIPLVILDFNLEMVSRPAPWHCTKRTTFQAERSGSPWRECVRCKCHCHRVCTRVARRPLTGTAPNFRRQPRPPSHPSFLYWLNTRRLRTLKPRDVSLDLHKISGLGIRGWFFHAGCWTGRFLNSQCCIF